MRFAPVTVYRSAEGVVAQRGEDLFRLPHTDMDFLFSHDDPARWLQERLSVGIPILAPSRWMPPIQNQEVWAAGVTYCAAATRGWSRPRMRAAARSTIECTRPSVRRCSSRPRRTAWSGTGGAVRIRSDSHWNVPEPELTLAINARGRIFGYTIGNDMSSRDIEGENPLYLPQAKVWDACCGLGPGIVVRDPLPPETAIRINVLRDGADVFAGRTALSQMKRGLEELADYLFRDNSFPNGCFLLTGTGVVPPNEFTLQSRDEIRIHIDHVGTLVNFVT